MCLQISGGFPAGFPGRFPGGFPDEFPGALSFCLGGVWEGFREGTREGLSCLVGWFGWLVDFQISVIGYVDLLYQMSTHCQY